MRAGRGIEGEGRSGWGMGIGRGGGFSDDRIMMHGGRGSAIGGELNKQSRGRQGRVAAAQCESRYKSFVCVAHGRGGCRVL